MAGELEEGQTSKVEGSGAEGEYEAEGGEEGAGAIAEAVEATPANADDSSTATGSTAVHTEATPVPAVEGEPEPAADTAVVVEAKVEESNVQPGSVQPSEGEASASAAAGVSRSKRPPGRPKGAKDTHPRTRRRKAEIAALRQSASGMKPTMDMHPGAMPHGMMGMQDKDFRQAMQGALANQLHGGKDGMVAGGMQGRSAFASSHQEQAWRMSMLQQGFAHAHQAGGNMGMYPGLDGRVAMGGAEMYGEYDSRQAAGFPPHNASPYAIMMPMGVPPGMGQYMQHMQQQQQAPQQAPSQSSEQQQQQQRRKQQQQQGAGQPQQPQPQHAQIQQQGAPSPSQAAGSTPVGAPKAPSAGAQVPTAATATPLAQMPPRTQVLGAGGAAEEDTEGAAGQQYYQAQAYPGQPLFTQQQGGGMWRS